MKGPVAHYVNFWTNFVDFKGRAKRPEFWWPVLFNLVVNAILGLVSPYLGGIFSLLILIPGLSIAFRRLHDIKKSGWNLLWVFLPVIGWIILIVLFARK